jgi:hypothetical protein
MVELYVEISSIDNAGDSLNNLPKKSVIEPRILFLSIINLAHQKMNQIRKDSFIRHPSVQM